MLDDHTFGVEDPERGNALERWYRRNRPAVFATLWLWLLFLILAGVTLLTGWASRPVTLVLQMVLSFGAGLLAGWYHRRDRPEIPRYTRLGALAGFLLPFTTAIVIVIVALVIGIGSLGTLLPLMIPYFLSLPLELIFCSGLGALGGRIVQGLADRKPLEPG